MLGTRQKGLRNRFRNGRGTYSVKRKADSRDRYGQADGSGKISDTVAGTSLTYFVGKPTTRG